MSQLDLALRSGFSARHVSFIETGRTQPSRQALLALAESLDMPLRDRNRLLEAAGYAHVYRQTPLAAEEMALVRAWGFPARYVMGYLDPGYVQSPAIQLTTHAWAEVLIPGAGWRGFDATLQLVCDQTYVAMTMGRDYLDAAPQRGSFKGEEGGQPPQVHLQIMRQQ